MHQLAREVSIAHRQHVARPRRGERGLKLRQAEVGGEAVSTIAELSGGDGGELGGRVVWQLQPRRLHFAEVGHGAVQRLDRLRGPEEMKQWSG